MPSIIDLWDEKKYSEGDPVRQLIAATKAVKEWPMDTLNWGNELVDMTTGGLNKIFPRIPKTHLAKTLPHSIYGDKYDSPSLSEYPAQDVQDGRTVGRLLNPALLFSGNQRVPLPKTGEFNAGRRALITQEAVDDTDKLSAAIEALKNKPMTRREFNKGMAVGGAAVAASPLLSKFNKTAKVLDDAPELSQLSKGVALEGQNYKYNTLSDYLNDLTTKANSGNYSGFGDSPEEIVRSLLREDEYLYKANKAIKEQGKLPEDYGLGSSYEPILHEFSPQAKEEMKAFKEHLKQTDAKNTHPFESRSDIIDAYERWKNPPNWDTEIPF